MASQMEAHLRKAIVLLSGGLDSATVLAIAKNEGMEITTLSFDYGQRHRFELDAAERIADSFNVVNQVVMKIDLRAIGGSALTTDTIDVPKHNQDDDRFQGESSSIPVTYVPARNTIFLSFSLALAEVIGANDIYIGVNAVDYSGYPDCRPEFINAFERLANLATKVGVENNHRDQPALRIHAPLLNLTKSQIIRCGIELGVEYRLTHSCYDPDPESGNACGLCDACVLRRKGFKQAGVPDPTQYVSD